MKIYKRIKERTEKKKRRIKSRLKASLDKPLVTVFKSNSAISCILFDKINNKVLKSVSSRDLYKDSKNCNKEKANETGKKMGIEIKKLKYNSIVFNRNGYLYHGKVKALAEGIRECEIKF